MATRDNVFINEDKRTFYIHDVIDKDSMSKTCFSLLEILNDDEEKESKEKDFKRKPIKIYINSVGGNIDDMWSLISIMGGSKSPIYTYCTAYAHSAGFLIFIAGKKRFITEFAVMCCHQFSGGITGKYQEIKEQIAQYDRTWDEIEAYIVAQTNITKERLREVRERKLDWFIHSEESIGLGVATDIITRF